MQTAAIESLSQPWRNPLLRFVPFIFSGIILSILPPFLPTYIQSLMTKILIFAIFSMSLDLLMGYTGLISLGHAAYFGAGAYTVGALTLHYGINNLWLSAPLGILAAAVIAAIFGLVALRVSGAYFILVTLALGQLLFSVAWKWRWLSSPGAEGIAGIARPDIGLPGFTWSYISFYYFVFLALIIIFFLLNRLVNSPFGYALQGIREGELRMRALGYNTWLYRYIAFVIGGTIAGLSGVLFAYHNSVVVPEHLAMVTSGLAMFMVILGGTGTIYGSIIGAAVIITVEYYSGIFTPERWPLILGGAFVVCIMYARQGVGVYLFRMWNKAVIRYGSIKS